MRWSTSIDLRPATVLVLLTLLVAGCTGEQVDGTAVAANPPPRQAVSTPARPSDLDALRADFAEFTPTLPGIVGLSFAAVNGSTATTLGEWSGGVAWSTIKVPLSIAALRHSEPTTEAAVEAAITLSDNASAEQLWEQLGTPTRAGAAVQTTLQDFGDNTTQVQSQRIRPPYSSFGQTEWSLAQQTLFTAHLPCRPEAAPVIDLMRNLDPSQQWGLARIAGTASKAGWGPDENGAYLVRQLALITTATGQVAVAVAAKPASGTFSGATAILDQLTAWLQQHITALPTGNC